MSNIDEIMATIAEDDVRAIYDEILIIDPLTRQINVPGSELIFGVESDGRSERKYFQCPRVVGDNIDLSSCFFRVNYRNANGEIDTYLVEDVAVDGENITFSWELSKKVTRYMGQTKFLVCAYKAGLTNIEWNTTVSSGIVLEGLEPDIDGVVDETSDVVAQLIDMVNTQTVNVENVGAEQIASVRSVAEAEKTACVAEIEAKGINTLNSIPNDYTALYGAVGAIERGMAPGIVCEAEGESIVISDASDRAVQNIRVFGKSTQNGVPSPDAPVEIESVKPTIGVYGKNLITSYVDTTKTSSGITFTVNEDGSITCNGTATEAALFNMVTSYETSPIVRPGATYTISGATNIAAIQIYEWQDTWVQRASTSGSTTFTFSDNVKGVLIRYVINPNLTANNITVYPMLRLVSEDATYSRGKSAQTLKINHDLHGIPVESGGNYTDSNGKQWICDEIDLERGVYVQRVMRTVFDGSSDEGWRRDYTSDENKRRMSTSLFSETIKRTANGTVANILCNRFLKARADDTYSLVERISVDDLGRIHVYSNTYNNLVEDWISFLSSNPLEVVFELAEKIETPLTETEIATFRSLHTNKPNTTILNDAGAYMGVEYIADTKTYIDHKITAIVSGN